MQNEGNIPKRTRYAHSVVDVDTLKPGQDYDELKPSYVVFLCCFDCFGEDKPLYRFSMQEEENHLPLGDETYTIIVNSKASGNVSIPTPLQQLFRYMNDSDVAEGNELLEQIDRSVESWNTGEGRRVIMTLEQEILIREARAAKKAREEGRAEGHAEGRAEGHAEGLQQGRAEEREHSEQEKFESARKLKASGVASEIIAESLGLAEEEIKKL